jgi:ring-1,2-phenylacetyl-CoA epoxidase subunit PaaE
MEQGADVPFSCKGAVCCTCKARVMEGKVTMDANYSLSEEEVADGFVLGCQARPASENVVVDFDEM